MLLRPSPGRPSRNRPGRDRPSGDRPSGDRPCRSRRWPAAAIAVALALSVVPGAAAQTSDELRHDLDRAQERLDEIDARQSLAVEEYNTAQVALDDVTARLAETQREMAALREEHDKASHAVEDHLRRLHKMGPALELSTILIAGDPTEAGAKAWTMRRILDDQRIDLEALDASRIAIRATEARMQEEQQQAEHRAEEQQQARREVEAMFARTRDEIAELNALLAETVEEERRVAEEARRRREAEAAAARAEAEARDAEAAAAREASPSAPSPSASRTAPKRRTTPEPAPAPSTRQSADVAVQTALAQLGKPYQWGGSGPNSFDCSGLTSFAWRAAGVSIPRTSGSQYAGTKRISRDQLQPGDLVFYHSPISHVAMYIGNGQVVEAPNSGNNVRIRSDGLTRRGVVGYGRP